MSETVPTGEVDAGHRMTPADRQCSACGEYFNSAEINRERWRERRCLSVAEMTANGFRIGGTCYWITQRRPLGDAFGGTPPQEAP
jgi:hypothetical protein